MDSMRGSGEQVQLEIARRKNNPRRTMSYSPFTGKIVCGDCGEVFGSKVWHSTSKYRRTIWRCNAKYDALQQQIERRQIQAEAVRNCLDALKELELPQLTFTDNLWNTAIDHVTVFADKRLMFHFKNGSEVEVKIYK